MSDGYPFSAFNFEIRIHKEGDQAMLCGGAFSDCDGLEMTMDVKTIRQGGDNARQIRLAGPASLGQITLKRGMTEGFDLWDWFNQTIADPGLRANVQIVMFASGSKQADCFVSSGALHSDKTQGSCIECSRRDCRDRRVAVRLRNTAA